MTDVGAARTQLLAGLGASRARRTADPGHLHEHGRRALIRRGLLCGLPGATPVAIVQDATVPRQKQLVTGRGTKRNAVREGWST